MGDSIKTFFAILLEVILVVFAAVLLCLLVPALDLLELFLVLAGALTLAAGVSKLNDLIHYHKFQQLLRELELERQRRQLPPGHQQGNLHHTLQRRPRRLRGSCHS